MPEAAPITAVRPAAAKTGKAAVARLDGLVSVSFKEGMAIGASPSAAESGYDFDNLPAAGVQGEDIHHKWIYVFYRKKDEAPKFAAEVHALNPLEWRVWYNPSAKDTPKDRHKKKPVVTQGVVRINGAYLQEPYALYALLSRVPLSTAGLKRLAGDFRLSPIVYTPPPGAAGSGSDGNGKTGEKGKPAKLPSLLSFAIYDPYRLAEDAHQFLYMTALNRWHQFEQNVERQSRYLIAKTVRGWLDMRLPGEAADPVGIAENLAARGKDPLEVKEFLRDGEPDKTIEAHEKRRAQLLNEANDRMVLLKSIIQRPDHVAIDISVCDAFLKREGDPYAAEVGLYHYALITEDMIQVPEGMACADWLLKEPTSPPGVMVFNDDPGYDVSQASIQFWGGRKVFLGVMDVFTFLIPRKMFLLEQQYLFMRPGLLAEAERNETAGLKKKAEAIKTAAESQKLAERGKDLANLSAEELARAEAAKADAAKLMKKADTLGAEAGALANKAATKQLDAAKDIINDKILEYLKRLGVEGEIKTLDAGIEQNLKEGKLPFHGERNKIRRRKIRRRVLEIKKNVEDLPDAERTRQLYREAGELKGQADELARAEASVRAEADRLSQVAKDSVEAARDARVKGDLAGLASDELKDVAEKELDAAERYLKARFTALDKLKAEKANALEQMDDCFDGKAPGLSKERLLITGMYVESVVNVLNLWFTYTDARDANAFGDSFAVNALGGVADLTENVAGTIRMLTLKKQLQASIHFSPQHGALSIKLVRLDRIIGPAAFVGALMDAADASLKARDAAVKTGDYKVTACYVIAAAGAVAATVTAAGAWAGAGWAGGPVGFAIATVGAVLLIGFTYIAEKIRDNDYQVFVRHSFLAKTEEGEADTARQPDWSTVMISRGNVRNQMIALNDLLGRFRARLFAEVERGREGWNSRGEIVYPYGNAYLVLEITPGALEPEGSEYHADIEIKGVGGLFGREPDLQPKTTLPLSYDESTLARILGGATVPLRHEWPLGKWADVKHRKRLEYDCTIQLRQNGNKVGKPVKLKGDMPSYSLVDNTRDDPFWDSSSKERFLIRQPL